MRRLLLLVALTCAACSNNDSPTQPTTVRAPVTPACQTNSLAYVKFGNRSAATTQTVNWDGLNVATISPGQDSPEITVAAGVAHVMIWRITNTNTLACTTTSPIPTVCGTPIYTCAFP